MIAADAFLDPARDLGYGFYAGVPCSFLTPIINRVIGDPRLEYVGATSEGEAVAIASGAWLAGRKTVVMPAWEGESCSWLKPTKAMDRSCGCLRPSWQ